MKKLITTYIFLLSMGVFAINSPDKVAEVYSVNASIKANTDHSTSTPSASITYKEFEKAARRSGIPHRRINNLKEVKNGYYVISGVFGSQPNAAKSAKKLRKRGFDSNYINIPDTGMNYVYLEYFEEGQKAIEVTSTGFDGRYSQDVWIMVAENTIEPVLKPRRYNKGAPIGNKRDRSTLFHKSAKENSISTRTVRNLNDVKDGFYIIAGVFGSEFNARKSVDKLKKKGFNSDYINIADTGMNYVYLEYLEEGQKAIQLASSGFDGRHAEEVWIMVTENNVEPVLRRRKHKNTAPIGNKRKKNFVFRKSAKENSISTRTVHNLNGVKDGFYIISGVFGSKFNAMRSAAKLRKNGFDSHYINIPDTGMNYVYLQYHENGQAAIDHYNKDIKGRYAPEVWILVAQHSADPVRGSKAYDAPAHPSERDLMANHLAIKRDKDRAFLKSAKENTIPTRTFRNLEGVKDGFYVIAGVYSNERNVKKMVKKFNKKGFESDYIKVSDTGLNYMYLQYHQEGQKAIEACLSQLNGKHKESVWIMKVEESDPVPESDSVEEQYTERYDTQNEPGIEKEAVPLNQVSYDMLNELPEEKSTQLISNTPNKSKLIEKADSYFNKMWYAEAAELYEQALLKGEKYYSFDIIQKAADAHYFNTNMEKAYEWYNVLYEQYGKELSADNIFKYAHSLKGTGKYARSKKLMRLYNKKMAKGNGNISSADPTPNEVVLDNILGTTQDFDIKNMAINTEYSEFSPMFLDSSRVVFSSAKDSSFFNTRRYKWNNQPYLDLYVAKINEESQDLKDAIKFSKKINTKYHEASVTFSPDNLTMYFTRNNYGKKLKRDKNGINHLKIYMSNKVDGEWTEAREVSFNSDNYSTGHPALSPDGKKLYFVSDMPGSIGGTDLFVVNVLGNGSFSEPKNLGPDINTERREMFPFINDKKLYFSSDGHTGLGGLDVYEAAIGEEGEFQEVINLGQPVNSNMDDFSYIVNEENQKGFFASNRAGGKGDDDIYSFKRLLVEEAPENMNAIAGVITELISGDLMPQTLVELLDENGIKLKEMVTEDDGSFIFEDLDSNTKYTIKTTKGDFFDEEMPAETKDNELVNVSVNLRRLEEMIAIEDGIKKLKTEMIFFDFDKSYIRNDAADELNRLVEVMKEYPNMVIKIESHTDSRGTKTYNKYLSNKRAKSTRDYIISQGIDASRIESATGYGEERLLNECNGRVRCTEQKHFLNRRSEFIIVNM